MKQLLFLVIPCVVAIVLVNAGGYQPQYYKGQDKAVIYNYVKRVPGRAVYYPYPVRGPMPKRSIVGPLIDQINRENQMAFLANACK